MPAEQRTALVTGGNGGLGEAIARAVRRGGDSGLPSGMVHGTHRTLALLDAENCPDEVMDLILAPDQMLLQIHESIGHPLELDRILGDERRPMRHAALRQPWQQWEDFFLQGLQSPGARTGGRRRVVAQGLA